MTRERHIDRAWSLGTTAIALVLLFARVAIGAENSMQMPAPAYYLPNAEDSRIVTVTKSGSAAAGVTVITQAVAEKENEHGTQNCLLYAFVPSFIAVRRDEPTQISFRNYQADDDHDFMLVGPDSSKVLMFVLLPKLRETSYVFTFHREGLFRIYCTMHQPEMSGQILVLPPASSAPKASSGNPAASGAAAPSESYVSAAAASAAEPKLPDCRIYGRQLEEEMADDIRRQNWDAVAKLISPAFQSVRADKVRDRAGELALLQGLKFTSHTIGFRITYSGDVAILTYDSYYYVPAKAGAAQRKTSRVLSVWRMTNAGWQWIARSEVPITGTSAQN
ncbi:MAG: DUF4440 domain-containing protein [Candidatus Binataceae bacterium]